MPAKSLKLDRKSSMVFIVDVQDRLALAMPPEALARVLKYSRALLHCARTLDMPALASEQYPRGLGHTLPEVRELLPEAPLEKTHFSCASDPELAKRIEATHRKQVIVAGMEAHVCLFQTTRDLVAKGYEVHVCADAVASRSEEHRLRGLDLCREAGAVITTAETAIFDLLHQAGTPEFKAVAPWVK